MTRPLIHPSMLSRLGNLYPSTCTIQVNTMTRDPDSGEPIASWANLAGYIDLACAVAPNGGQEVQTVDQTIVLSDYTISLPEDMTAVEPAMQAVVTGPNAGTYGILSVQTDSRGATSRMLVRKVS